MLRIFIMFIFFFEMYQSFIFSKEYGNTVEMTSLYSDIQEGLKVLDAKSPIVHKDALRIWKNFKAGRSNPSWTYRYWGRDLILWLQEVKSYSFSNVEKIGDVFEALYDMGYISQDAARVLTHNVAALMSHLQGDVDPSTKQKDKGNVPSEKEKLLKSI